MGAGGLVAVPSFAEVESVIDRCQAHREAGAAGPVMGPMRRGDEEAVIGAMVGAMKEAMIGPLASG